ncbi:MAG: hypothetical protein HQ581_15280 [Planctomycetes bacterium]|nr:hypothetical protein [Planctomycetota bacterium]
MTSSDRAFIKAYSHVAETVATTPLPLVASVSLSEALPREAIQESTELPSEELARVMRTAASRSCPGSLRASVSEGAVDIVATILPQLSQTPFPQTPCPPPDMPDSAPAAALPEGPVEAAEETNSGNRLAREERESEPAIYRLDQATGLDEQPEVHRPHVGFPAGVAESETAGGEETSGGPTRPSLDVSGTQPEGPPIPAWQVDHFAWTTDCQRLLQTAQGAWDQLGEALIRATSHGRKVLGIGGARSGEGSTAVLLCAARQLAQRGLSVAIVDGDFQSPRLAERLGLAPEAGWEQVLQGEAVLSDALIESTGDNLIILPLAHAPTGSHWEHEGARLISETLAMMRRGFDLVLVDMGALESGTTGELPPEATALAASLDASILVRDVRSTPRYWLGELQNHLAMAGATPIGVVENFVVS